MLVYRLCFLYPLRELAITDPFSCRPCCLFHTRVHTHTHTSCLTWSTSSWRLSLLTGPSSCFHVNCLHLVSMYLTAILLALCYLTQIEDDTLMQPWTQSDSLHYLEHWFAQMSEMARARSYIWTEPTLLLDNRNFLKRCPLRSLRQLGKT